MAEGRHFDLTSTIGLMPRDDQERLSLALEWTFAWVENDLSDLAEARGLDELRLHVETDDWAGVRTAVRRVGRRILLTFAAASGDAVGPIGERHPHRYGYDCAVAAIQWTLATLQAEESVSAPSFASVLERAQAEEQWFRAHCGKLGDIVHRHERELRRGQARTMRDALTDWHCDHSTMFHHQFSRAGLTLSADEVALVDAPSPFYPRNPSTRRSSH
ncbi:MAG: hypothetical protein LCH66_13650 [Actinobacteria bacterium]|jgi:hypothetical protein|nr:hypothetical protein [Actinomycetota bacterium]